MYAKQAIRGYPGPEEDKDIPHEDDVLYQQNADRILAAISDVGSVKSLDIYSTY
jgi:hypothetical protein